MNHQQLAPEAPAVPVERDVSSPVPPDSHHLGLEELREAFAEARPVAIVIGEKESGVSYLVGRFLAEREGDVTAARIAAPRLEYDTAMRDVAQAVGFDLQDMSLVNLESEFRNFLSYQKHNNRRTIICFEDIQQDARQVLDIALRLIELEQKEKCGLMLILSGLPGLNTLLHQPPSDALCAYVAQPIALGPFTLTETREHISRGVEAAGISDIGQVFETDAITCIHEISAGVPDEVDALSCKCIRMVAEKDNSPITADLAETAAKLLQQELVTQSSDAEAQAARVNGASAPIGRLIARMHGVVVKEQALSHGHVLIGRGRLCDIPVTNPLVSRHHALVVNSATGVNLIDLGSTNGTFVDGRQIDQRALQNGDVITIGDCRIAYVAGDDRQN